VPPIAANAVSIGCCLSWCVRRRLEIGRKGRRYHSRVAVLVLTVLLSSPPLSGYTILTHEAIIDSVWDDSLRKQLLKRFPGATPEELERAHAYGGSSFLKGAFPTFTAIQQ
jgi:hypothetical protein